MSHSPSEAKWAAGSQSNDSRLGRVNWTLVLRYASFCRAGRDTTQTTICRLADDSLAGGQKLVRRIDFDDGVKWVVRLQLPAYSPDSGTAIQHEVDVMQLMRSFTSVPVPKVHAFETSEFNLAGVPFIMMEYIPNAFASHPEGIPPQLKPKYHGALADVQAQISAIRFDKIGAVYLDEDGKYKTGPLPEIGGPFKTPGEFFAAWAGHAKFPHTLEQVQKMCPPNLAGDFFRSIESFPSRLRRLASVYRFQEGPFPLYHPSFHSSNVVVDGHCNVQSIVDWEGAFAVPWELVRVARAVAVTPPAMDGPLHIPDVHELEQHNRYIESVRDVERIRRLDRRLSATLEDTSLQAFASAFWKYGSGDVGFYGAILDKLEQRHNDSTMRHASRSVPAGSMPPPKGGGGWGRP